MAWWQSSGGVQSMQVLIKTVKVSWCRHCLCLFGLLCTRGKYWSVWLIIPTMIFTQETLHGLRPLASTINRCQRRAEADICHGDWPVLSSSHIFSWLRPWLDPCLARLWRLPRAEIVNTNSLLRFLTLTDGLVPASWPQRYTSSNSTSNSL